MILCNISVEWKICTNLSDNRFSCGLTRHCLGERRLEIWVLIRAGWALKYRRAQWAQRVFQKDLAFPELIWTVKLFAVFPFTRPCGVAGALMHSPGTRNALELCLPCAVAAQLSTAAGLCRCGRGDSAAVSFASWLWALVIRFTWQLARALGLRTHFTFAGGGTTFDRLVSKVN